MAYGISARLMADDRKKLREQFEQAASARARERSLQPVQNPAGQETRQPVQLQTQSTQSAQRTQIPTGQPAQTQTRTTAGARTPAQQPAKSAEPEAPAVTHSRKFTWADYQKYENDYRSWQQTKQHGDGFGDWATQEGLDAWRAIRDRNYNGQQAALIGDTYYTMSKDDYDRYEKDYKYWKKHGKHMEGFDTWATQDDLDSWRAIRDYNIGVRNGTNLSMETQSIVNGLDPEALQLLAEQYRASWSYGSTDEDLARKAAGQPPKSKDKYYKNGTEFDRWLYSQGLPSTQGDYFSRMYDAAYAEVAKRREEQAAAGGQAAESGQARGMSLSPVQAKSMADYFREDWTYGNSTEDKARKRSGRMPKSVEAMYEDTEADRYNKEHGLPPEALFDDYLTAYANETAATRKRFAGLQSAMEEEQERVERGHVGQRAAAPAGTGTAPGAQAAPEQGGQPMEEEPEDLLAAATGAGKWGDLIGERYMPGKKSTEPAEMPEEELQAEDAGTTGNKLKAAFDRWVEAERASAKDPRTPQERMEEAEQAWAEGERTEKARAPVSLYDAEPEHALWTLENGEARPERIGTAPPEGAERDLLTEAVGGGDGRGVGPQVRKAQAGPVRALPKEDDSAEQSEVLTFLMGMKDAGMSRGDIEAYAGGDIPEDLLDRVFGAEPRGAADPYAMRPANVDEYDWNSMIGYLQDHAGEGREAFDESGQWDDPVSQQALDAVFGAKSAEQVEYELEADKARQEAIETQREADRADRWDRFWNGRGTGDMSPNEIALRNEMLYALYSDVDPSTYASEEELAGRDLIGTTSRAADFLYSADGLPASQLEERIRYLDQAVAKLEAETPWTASEAEAGKLTLGEAGRTMADYEAQRAKLVAMMANARAQEALEEGAKLYAACAQREDWADNIATVTDTAAGRNKAEKDVIQQFRTMDDPQSGDLWTSANAGPGSGKYGFIYQATESERQLFYYLCNTQGTEAGFEYLDRMLPVFNARGYQNLADIAAYASEHYPTLTTIGMATIGQLPSAVEGVAAGGSKILYDLSGGKYGNDFTVQSPGTQFTYLKHQSTANIRQQIVESSGSELLGMAYDLGVSFLENASRAVLFGGAPGGELMAAGTMYGQVFASTVYDYINNKGTDSKTALYAGFLNAGAEALGEAVTFGQLMSLKDLVKAGKTTPRLIAQWMGHTILKEGGSEGITCLCEKAIDYVLNGDESELAKLWDEKYAETGSKGKAWGAVLLNTLKDAGIESAVGAVNGLLLSGGNLVFTRMKYGKNIAMASMITQLTEDTNVDAGEAVAVNMIERELREKGPNMDADERMAMMAEIRNMEGLTDAQKDHYMDVLESFATMPQSMTSEETKGAIEDTMTAAAQASMQKADIAAKARSRSVKKQAQLQTKLDRVHGAQQEMRTAQTPEAVQAAAAKVQEESAAYTAAYEQAEAEEKAAQQEDRLAVERAQAPMQQKLRDLERRADAEAGYLDEQVESRIAEEAAAAQAEAAQAEAETKRRPGERTVSRKLIRAAMEADRAAGYNVTITEEEALEQMDAMLDEYRQALRTSYDEEASPRKRRKAERIAEKINSEFESMYGEDVWNALTEKEDAEWEAEYGPIERRDQTQPEAERATGKRDRIETEADRLAGENASEEQTQDAASEQQAQAGTEEAAASEQQGAEADERLTIEAERDQIQREYEQERDALEVEADEADADGDTDRARQIEEEIRELDEEHRQLMEELDAEEQEGYYGTEAGSEDLGAGYAGEDRGEVGSEARAADGSGDQGGGQEAAGAPAAEGEVAPQAPFSQDQAWDIRRMTMDMANRGRAIAKGAITPAQAVTAQARTALDTLTRWTGVGQTVVYDSTDANAPAGFTMDGRTYARNGRDLIYNAAHEHAHNMPGVIGAIRGLLRDGTVSNEAFEAYRQARREAGAVDTDYDGAQEEFAADVAGAVLSEAIDGDAFYQRALRDELGISDDEYKALQDAVYEALAYDPEEELSDDDALSAAMGQEKRPEGVRYSGDVLGREQQGDLLSAAVPVYDVAPDQRRAEARARTEQDTGLVEQQGDLLGAATGQVFESKPIGKVSDAENEEIGRRVAERAEKRRKDRERRKERQRQRLEQERLAQQQRLVERGDLTPQEETAAREARSKRSRMTDEAAGTARELTDLVTALYGNLQETQRKKPNPVKVMTAVKNMLSNYDNDLDGVTMDRQEIADGLADLIERYRNAEDPNRALDDLMAGARDLAERILGSRELSLEEYTGMEAGGEYDALMELLDETPLKVGPKGREQLKKAYGSLKEFRKAVGDDLHVKWVHTDTESTFEDLNGMIGGYLEPEVEAQLEKAFGGTNTLDIVDLAEFVQAQRESGGQQKQPYSSIVSPEEYADHADRLGYEIARIAFDQDRKIPNLASYGDRGARAVGDVRKEIGRIAELASEQEKRIGAMREAGNEEADTMRHWLTASKAAYQDTYKAGKGERAGLEQRNAELADRNARLNAENERLARSETALEARRAYDIRKRNEYEQRALDAEAERAQLAKENERLGKRERTRKEKLRQADELFKAGMTARDYYEQDPANYDHEVARQLNGIRLRNGQDVGGRINEKAFETILTRSEEYRPQKTLPTSLASPVRVFEDVAGKYSPKNSNAENARIYRDAQQLKDTYYEYGNAKMSDRTTYVAKERQKIEDAWTKHGKTTSFDSAAVQLLGEGVCTEDQIRNAVTDGKVMVVNGLDGTFVFRMYGHGKNKAAQLQAFCDSKKTYVYPTTGPFGQRSAKPTAINGTLTVNRDGGIVRVTDANGTVHADIAAGKGRGLNTDAVTATSKALRDYYDRALREQNRVLVENGYAPIRKVQDYFPHIGRQETGLNGFLQFMKAENLPTSINGLTATFKPGKPWAAHMQERLGAQTEYDAIRGFNRYVESAGDQIYKTPVVQRLRQLENGLREHAGRSDTRNAAFVNWLREYANQYANKKADLDRGSEGVFGRFAYQLSQKATGLFSGASVGGNVSSSLSNLVSWFTGAAHMNPKYAVGSAWRQIVQGLSTGYDEEKGYDGFIRKIPYLNRAFGDAEAIRVYGENKAATIGGKLLYGLFGTVDRLAKESMGRAYYDGCMHKGMSEQEAIKRTDDFLIKNFADRGTGQAAKIFGIRTLKPIAQFQLEVLNQVYHFRDIDREAFENRLEKVMKEQGAKDATEIDWDSVSKKIYAGSRLPGLGAGGEELAKKMAYVVLLSLYGMFTRKWLGRDQSWNLFGMGLDIARGIREIPEGERTAEKVAGVVKDAAMDQAENNLPLLSTLNGGRVPVLGGVDTIKTGIRALTTERDKYEDSADVAVAAGKAALAFVPGGGQISKSARGALALKRGGQYNAKGTQLQYPVEDTAGNWLRGLLFGPSAMQPEGYDYQHDALSAKKTEAYKEVTGPEHGMDPMVAYGILGSYTGRTNALQSASLAAGAVQSEAEDPGEAFDTIAELMGYKRGMKRDGQDLASFVQEDMEKRRSDLQKKVDAGEITQEAADAEMDELERYLRIIRGY